MMSLYSANYGRKVRSWCNVIPHLQELGRCIAPDLIGMGDSEKLPNSGPGSYTFVEHRRYLDALLEELNMNEQVTLVLHDWDQPLVSIGPIVTALRSRALPTWRRL